MAIFGDHRLAPGTRLGCRADYSVFYGQYGLNK
jgi:hypothetical protein